MGDRCLLLLLEPCQRRWMEWAAMLFAEVFQFLPLFLSTTVARSAAIERARAGAFRLTRRRFFA